MNSLLTRNLDVVYFFYGLAFVVMGISILIQPRKKSIFRLSDIISILAFFGITHGASEWFEMFTLIKGYHSYLWTFTGSVLLVLSFIFLFEFGRRFLALNIKDFFFNTRLAVLWYFAAIMLTAIPAIGEPTVWARYLLCFPGALMTSMSISLYFKENRGVLEPIIRQRYFLFTTVALFFYGILGGLVVPETNIFPASVINNESFLKAFRIPVQVCRAVCALLISWGVWNILQIFNREIGEKLRNSLEEVSTAKGYCDSIINSSVESLFVIDKDARISLANTATRELLGYTPDEIIGLPVSGIIVNREIEEILNEFEEEAFLLSEDFVILAANERFLKSVNLSKDKVVGGHCYQLTHNLDHVCSPPRDRCPVQSLSQSHQSCVELHQHIDKNGRNYPVLVTAAPIKDNQGEILYYLHLSRSAVATESQNRRTLDDSDSVSLFIHKLERLENNLRMGKVLSTAELIKQANLAELRNAEFYYKTKSQDKIPISLSGAVMKSSDGEFLGIVCSAKDMREVNRLIQKEKEVASARLVAEAEHRKFEELQRVYEELEKSHTELKQAQNQLIQAEKMQVVGRLASGAAHEVKNPLAIIIQGVEYLKDKIHPQDEDTVSTLKYLEEAVSRADNVIRGLLDFSSLSNLDMKPQDLNACIDSALLLLSHHIKKNRIELVKELRQDLPLVKIDKNRIEQVLINLILNSVQAMPEGGKIEIKSYLAQIGSGEEWVIAAIEDSGIGISQGNLDKIFDPFFTTKRDIGGTGMGLSIVKNIVEIHGGKIAIENRKAASGTKATLMLKPV